MSTLLDELHAIEDAQKPVQMTPERIAAAIDGLVKAAKESAKHSAHIACFALDSFGDLPRRPVPKIEEFFRNQDFRIEFKDLSCVAGQCPKHCPTKHFGYVMYWD